MVCSRWTSWQMRLRRRPQPFRPIGTGVKNEILHISGSGEHSVRGGRGAKDRRSRVAPRNAQTLRLAVSAKPRAGTYVFQETPDVVMKSSAPARSCDSI